MAPEVMRSLKPSSEDNDELPFTMASDAYAFGYEKFQIFVQPQSITISNYFFQHVF